MPSGLQTVLISFVYVALLGSIALNLYYYARFSQSGQITDYETVQKASINDSSTTKNVVVECPAGKALLGGGGGVAFGSDSPTEIGITANGPAIPPYAAVQGVSNAWVVMAKEMRPVDENWSVVSYAICANTR